MQQLLKRLQRVLYEDGSGGIAFSVPLVWKLFTVLLLFEHIKSDINNYVKTENRAHERKVQILQTFSTTHTWHINAFTALYTKLNVLIQKNQQITR